MDLRELLNEDQLNCLYCNHMCDVKASSYASSNGQYHDHVEIFICNNCSETFQITITTASYNDIGTGSQTNMLFFIQFFTCKTIEVSIRNKKFFIQQKHSLEEVEVPPFEISFKSKEDLYTKLQTYLLFS